MFTNELQKNVYRKRIVNAEFLLCRTDGVPSMRLVQRSTQLCTKCVVPLQLAPMHISMVLECFSNWWCGFCVCLCLVFHAASCAHTCASGKIHTLRFANGCCFGVAVIPFYVLLFPIKHRHEQSTRINTWRLWLVREKICDCFGWFQLWCGRWANGRKTTYSPCVDRIIFQSFGIPLSLVLQLDWNLVSWQCISAGERSVKKQCWCVSFLAKLLCISMGRKWLKSGFCTVFVEISIWIRFNTLK